MLNRETSWLYQDLERVLLTREQIEARVAQLGAQISRDYAGRMPVCVGILKGATPFYCDLIRCIDLKMHVEFMATSSYGSATKSSGVVRILKDLDHDIVGRDVLVVEDIVDSGVTLNYLRENLMGRGARSIKICTLLDKPARRRVPLTPDYCGFVIEDAFVVGYGLDYDEKYRNLPDIGVLKEEIYAQ